jgi:hypothetical protein
MSVMTQMANVLYAIADGGISLAGIHLSTKYSTVSPMTATIFDDKHSVHQAAMERREVLSA